MWSRPVGRPAGLIWLGYRHQNTRMGNTLPPAPVSTLMWSEAVPFLLTLAGSWMVVYASLHCGARTSLTMISSKWVSDCCVGLDVVWGYLILRALVLSDIYGVCFVLLPLAVAVVPRWASGLPLLWPRWGCIPWLEWLATMAFWSPVSHLVTFGTMGIMCWAVCSASWVLSGAVGTVLGGCRWCVTIAAVAGVGCPPFVLADYVHRFGAVGDLFPGMLDSKVVHSNLSQLTGGCLEWLGHKFS